MRVGESSFRWANLVVSTVTSGEPCDNILKYVYMMNTAIRGHPERTSRNWVFLTPSPPPCTQYDFIVTVTMPLLCTHFANTPSPLLAYVLNECPQR